VWLIAPLIASLQSANVHGKLLKQASNLLDAGRPGDDAATGAGHENRFGTIYLIGHKPKNDSARY
jgi:hypothetical protein